MRLSFQSPLIAVSLASLTEAERALAVDLEQMGLLTVHGESYVATTLATQLIAHHADRSPTTIASSTTPTTTPTPTARSTMELVLESNFHLYCYSHSPVDVATVTLFAKLIVTLPNVFVAHMDYGSVLAALKRGARASDIIGYLRDKMSARMAQVPPSVVATVLEQVLLWEAERSRVHFTAGVLYDGFERDEFELVANFTEQHECLIWKNASQHLLFVREDSHEQVKAFIKLINAK